MTLLVRLKCIGNETFQLNIEFSIDLHWPNFQASKAIILISILTFISIENLEKYSCHQKWTRIFEGNWLILLILTVESIWNRSDFSFAFPFAVEGLEEYRVSLGIEEGNAISPYRLENTSHSFLGHMFGWKAFGSPCWMGGWLMWKASCQDKEHRKSYKLSSRRKKGHHGDQMETSLHSLLRFEISVGLLFQWDITKRLGVIFNWIPTRIPNFIRGTSLYICEGHFGRGTKRVPVWPLFNIRRRIRTANKPKQ